MLERLFPTTWVEKRGVYAFLIGLCLSIVGIGISLLVFPKDPALVSVAFTAILLLPEIRGILSREEHSMKSNKTMVSEFFRLSKTYLLLLLGVFVTYTLATMLLDSMTASIMFREQLAIRGAAAGTTLFNAGLLASLMGNNAIVLAAIFLISFLTGDGGIFLLTWNASVWGTIFGITAKNAALLTQKNPFAYLVLILIIVLPHAILELMAYISAAMAGGILSDNLIKEEHLACVGHYRCHFGCCSYFLAHRSVC